MSTSSLSSFPLWLLDPPGRQRFNQSDSSGSSQTSPRASLPASSPVSPPPVSQSDLAGIVVSHQVHPSSVAPNWLAPQDTEKEFRYYSELSLRGHPFLVSSQRRRDINSPTHVQQAQQTPVWPRLGDHQPLPILQSEYTSSEKPKVLRPSPSRRTLLSEPARPKEIVKLEHHFNAPGFRLPVAEGSRHTSPLTERELMWLVSASI